MARRGKKSRRWSVGAQTSRSNREIRRSLRDCGIVGATISNWDGKGWRKARSNPTRSQKQAKAWANAHKVGLRGRSSRKRSRRAQKWALTAHMLGRRDKRGRRWNPPISASDLKVLRRILAVHERDNRSRRGRKKGRR